MIKVIKYIAILFLCFSCKNNAINRPDRPENLIPENQMVDVLYDMALMSSAKGINRKILEEKGVVPEVFVYEKHNIDSVQFALSSTYYSYDIKTYETLYDQVKARLENDKNRFQVVLNEEKRIRDSTAIFNKKRDSLRRVKNRKQNDSARALRKANPNRLGKKDMSQK